MKLNWFTITLLAGLAVCGLLVVRHHRRTPEPGAGKPLDDWQRAIRYERSHKLRFDGNWRDRLRREEQRQRPQEGRN